MMPLIAQQFSMEDASTTLKVLNVLLVVFLFWKLFSRKDPAPVPQPMVTKKEVEYVPRHEFAQLRSDHMALSVRIENVHNDLMKAGEDRAVKLHERLNQLIEPLAEIRGRVTALTDHMKSEKENKTRTR